MGRKDEKDMPEESLEDLLIRLNENKARSQANFRKNTGEVSNTVLVGREDQYRKAIVQAENCLTDKLDNQIPILLIEGEAGSGKTRLVKEIVENYKDAIILSGRCIDESASPYLPFINAIKEYCGIVPSDSDEVEAEKISQTLIKDFRTSFMNEGTESAVIYGTGALIGTAISGGIGLPIAIGLGMGVKRFREWNKKRKATPEQEKQNMEEFYRQSLNSISNQAPTILFLDDLQWMDKSSFDALRYSAEKLRENNILIVGTYRPEEAKLNKNFQEFIDHTNREKLMQRIKLERLDEKSIHSMIGNVVTQQDKPKNIISEEISNEIINKTDGNPLFVEELVYDLIDYYDLHGEINVNDINIPDRIETVIERRINKLDKTDFSDWKEKLSKIDKTFDNSRTIDLPYVIELLNKYAADIKIQKKNPTLITELSGVITQLSQPQEKYEIDVLKHAAVMGKHFEHDILSNALVKSGLNITEMELNNSLSKLMEKTLIKEIDSKKHIYTFDHALIREVVYDNKFAGTQKEKIHLNVGEALEEKFKDELNEVLDQLAYHFIRSDTNNFETSNKAISYCLRAGKQAHETRYGHDEALIHYENALEINKNPTMETDLISEIIRLSKFAGQWDKALEFNQKIINKFEDSKFKTDQLEVAEAYKISGEVNTHIDLYDDAIEALDKGLEIFEKFGKVFDQAKLNIQKGSINYKRGKYDDALEDCILGLGILNEEPNKNIYDIAKAYGIIGIVNSFDDKYDEGINNAVNGIKILEEIDQISPQLSTNYLTLSYIYCSKYNIDNSDSDLEHAISYSTKAEKVSRELNDFNSLMRATGNLGYQHGLNENLDVAEEYCKETLKLSRGVNKEVYGCAYANYAVVYAKRGEWDKAEEFFDKSIDILEDINPYSTGESIRDKGHMFTKKGDYFIGLDQQEKGIKAYNDAANEYQNILDYLENKDVTNKILTDSAVQGLENISNILGK